MFVWKLVSNVLNMEEAGRSLLTRLRSFKLFPLSVFFPDAYPSKDISEDFETRHSLVKDVEATTKARFRCPSLLKLRLSFVLTLELFNSREASPKMTREQAGRRVRLIKTNRHKIGKRFPQTFVCLSLSHLSRPIQICIASRVSMSPQLHRHVGRSFSFEIF